MARGPSRAMIRPMKTTHQQSALPLAYTTEIMMEIFLMRDECSNLAQGLMNARPLDEPALEECAVLDDALAQAHRTLQAAVKDVRGSRVHRKNQKG